MKIAVCGSMVFSPEMLDLRKRLLTKSHEVILPEFTEDYAKLSSAEKRHEESTRNKIKHDLIAGYFHKIRESDAILVYNQTRKGIENYVGGNTFLEMGFAHVLGKLIFMQFPIPFMSYRDEMGAMHPIVINGDLERIASTASPTKIS